MKILKEHIRQEIKNKLKRLSTEERLLQSKLILQKLESLPVFNQANKILLFWSLPNEIHTHDFIQKWANKKTILLPVVVGNELILKEFTEKENMIVGAFNILEPSGVEFNDFSTIDICIIPGMAFDKAGNRLGKGKGFYDKLLPKIKAKKIGICFDFQIIENIPHDDWDQKMDIVISPF